MEFSIEHYKEDLYKISAKNKQIIEAVKSVPSKFNPIKKDWLLKRKDISRLINNLPKDTDSEILSKLKIVSRLPLNHQEQARDFLVDRKKAILADEMGGGKTFSSILAGNEIEGKKLVVCPSGLRYNWQKEISYTTNARIDVIEGVKDWIFPQENGWTIVSYDMLNEHMDTVLKEEYSVSIFDEAHYCRSVDRQGEPKSHRARNLIAISENVEYLFLLTGTPVVNGNKDLFNLLRAIGHRLSYDWKKFARRYCGAKKVGKGWTYDSNSNEEELYELLKYRMIRRLKDEFVDLPQKKRNFIPVEVDMKDYWGQVNEYMEARNLTAETGKHLVFLNVMRNTIAKEKIQHTIKLSDELVEKGESVVIFTNFKSVVNSVMNHYGDNAVRITGEDNGKKREENVRRFQEGEVKVIVCNLIAGGVGITLINSSNLIMNDLGWLPAEHLQAEDRIHRIGQWKECNIYYMYAKETIDEKMSKTLERRLGSISKTLNGTRESFVGDVVKMFNKVENNS